MSALADDTAVPAGTAEETTRVSARPGAVLDATATPDRAADHPGDAADHHDVGRHEARSAEGEHAADPLGGRPAGAPEPVVPIEVSPDDPAGSVPDDAPDGTADDPADDVVDEGMLEQATELVSVSGAQVVQDAPAPTPAQLRVDFGAHLEAHYRRLVAQLYAITLDPAEAHSAVQDAYSRAWRSWATVSRSPDATGWVRRVAVHSTTRSWRRLRPRPRMVGSGPDPRTGALLAALRRLPAPERRCIVLHYMAGAPLQEIAAVESVSVGTTAARLARAQQVVGDGLADLLAGGFGPDDSPGALGGWAAPEWEGLQPAALGTADHEEDKP